MHLMFFLKMRHSGLFLFIFVFSTVKIKYVHLKNVDDWI